MRISVAFRLLAAVLMGGLAACGGGGPGNTVGGSPTPFSSPNSLSSASNSSLASIGADYLVSTVSTAGGHVSPESQLVQQNQSAQFTVAADPDYVIESVTGCGGSLLGEVFTTAPINMDCVVEAQFTRALYPLHGNVTGLLGSVQLMLSAADTEESLSIANNGIFSFSTKIAGGQDYAVHVVQQPDSQRCELVNSSGTMSADGDELTVVCVALASVSGTLSPTNGIKTDSDVNDLAMPYVDNSVPSSAQLIHHLAIVNGFASAEPTNGSAITERFAETADEDDFYKVTLEAGQTVQLQVVNHRDASSDGHFIGDLDLYIFDGTTYEFVNGSATDTQLEEVTVPASGEFIVNVHAQSGISKYVLRLLPASTGNETQTSNVPLEFVPNEMIVKFHGQDALGLTAKGRTASGISASVKRPMLTGIDQAEYARTRAMRELSQLNQESHEKLQTLIRIKLMRQRTDVAYAEPNYIRKLFLTPNDPAYQYQWHYRAIGLPLAWETSTGVTLGAPVVVAVIDTGVVLSHPDLQEQLTVGYDFISDASRARDGDGIDPDPNDPGDSDTKGQSSWHGTHVAGTVAAASNNGVGVAGVAWNARVMPLRALGKDGGSSYDIIQAVRYAAGLDNDSNTLPTQKADIINLSLGGPHYSLAEQEVYEAVRAAGVIVVAAAGNQNVSTPLYPAAYPQVISVSATDYTNQKALYSNFGSTVDVAAPGGDGSVDLNRDGYPDGVLSTAADDTRGAIRPEYRYYQGTSMAAPHVAGVVALMKAVYPGLTAEEVDNLLINGDLTDDLGAKERDDVYGHGLINAVKSVEAANRLARGAVVAEPAPKVVATPAELNMDFKSTVEFTLDNQGGGLPAVIDWSVDVGWLSVTASSVDSSGLGVYTVVADKAGLEDGAWSADIRFTLSDQSEILVPLTVLVDSVPSQGELTHIRIFLLEADTGVIVSKAATEVASGFVNFEFLRVAPGSYYLVAGSDVDADGIICQRGELCGIYSSAEMPFPLEGMDLWGVDFPIGGAEGHPLQYRDVIH